MISDHSGYPLPSYATTIWLDGKGNLQLALPSGPDSKAHVITIPLAKCQPERTPSGAIASTSAGIVALLDVLKQRAAAQPRPVRLGDRAAPVQYDIEAMLTATRRPQVPAARRFNERGQQQLAYQDLFGEESK